MLSWIFERLTPDGDLSTTLFPPKSNFSPDKDVPDLAGKVFLVTGGNAGIGYQTIKQLLLHNADRVYLGARSEGKAATAIKQLQEETGKGLNGQLVFLKLDLGSLPSVKAATEEFLKKEKKLDVLFNNAGVMVPPVADLTAHNYDLRTNVLGHYFFTKLLIPALLAAKKTTGVPSRIVNLSSSGHRQAPAEFGGFAPSTLVGGPERDAQLKAWGFMASAKLYGQSKLGNIFVSNIFARAHPGKIVSVALHPGGIRTELQRHLEGGLMEIMNSLMSFTILFPAPYGAFNSLYVGLVAPPEEVNGQYYVPWTRRGNPIELAKNIETQEEVRKWMEKELLPYA